MFGSVADKLIRHSDDIEVDVISGDGEPSEAELREVPQQKFAIGPYLRALSIIVIATLVARSMHNTFALVNLVMIYQLAVVWISVRYGRGPFIISAVLSVAACDFFFVPPYYSFAVTDTQYLVTLLTMLVVALTLSSLTHNFRHQAEVSRMRERRTAALYAMTKEQAVAVTQAEVVSASAKHLHEVFDCDVAICLADGERELQVQSGIAGSYDMDSHEFGVAQWVFNKGQLAGAGTSTLPGARGMYLPLRGSSEIIGVIGIRAADMTKFLHPDEMHLLELFVNQIALAIQRATISEKNSKSMGHKKSV